MTIKQKEALNKARKHLTGYGTSIKDEEVKEFADGSLTVVLETWLDGCKSMMVQELTRSCYIFHIGKSGGYYSYRNSGKRRYFGIYEFASVRCY